MRRGFRSCNGHVNDGFEQSTQRYGGELWCEDGIRGIACYGGFFDCDGDADKFVATLESERIPNAIIGGLALNEYGHKRVTVDVDLVMRNDHLQEFKVERLG